MADFGLKDFLYKKSINDETIEILEKEMVLSKEIFCVLKEEHFERLLPHVKVGQHALLLKLWEETQVYIYHF